MSATGLKTGSCCGSADEERENVGKVKNRVLKKSE
jgi:hypothetical protein